MAEAGTPETWSAAGLVTVREAVFDLLRSFRITTIFGNPGSTELPMFRDFPTDFRYVLGLQEAAAMAMADGLAQAERNAAVVNLHSSAGVGHSLGNLFTAFRNQTPLIVIAGQQARSILPYEPFLFAEQPAEFPKPFVKWSVEPARAEDVPAAIARAYHVAMTPPCGPTFVSVPVDDWDRMCEPVPARTVSRRIHGDPAMLAEIAEALSLAERPVLVAGPEVARDEAWDEIVALAERHQAEVWASPMSSRNSFPEDHRLFAGFLPSNREGIVAALAGRDLILALGAPVFTYHVEGFGPHIPEGARLFLITANPAWAAWAPAGTAVIASPKPAIATLLEGPQPRARAAPSPRPEPPPIDGTALTGALLMQRIGALKPKGAVFTEESPSTRGMMQKLMPLTERDSFYATASGGLGFALPAAVGVALGRPGERVICIVGDGSAMYAPQALWSAGQLGLPITFIIVNNCRYEALVSFAHHFGMQETVGTRLPSLDFVQLAQGHGLAATKVTKVEELDAALTEAFAADGPRLVEVMVD
jgi:benzoylformate decarboxylase